MGLLGLLGNSILLDVWLILLFLTGGVMYYFYSRAVMRGQTGKPIPWVVDKIIRTFCCALFCLPICSFFPYVTVPLCLAYWWTFIDGSEQANSRPSRWVRQWAVWRFLKRYFSLSAIRTVDFDPNKKYIIGVHPHGILPFGTMCTLLTDAVDPNLFQGLKHRVLAASLCFYVPGYRDMLLGGGVIDAARYCAKEALKNGYSLILVPGGATEALYTTPTQDVVYLKNRKGFVRLALEYGCDLVPCYSFGEAETFEQMQGESVAAIKKLWQKIFGISLPLIKNIIPRKVKITPVLGKPIPVQKVEDPTKEQVQELLDKYTKALQDLYEEYKHLNNQPNKKPLKII
eukprot:TRINITY_DN7482_c0_g1_i1.p1 TRINITY_DN7482_c0_g1~~TRINITY_DN7482_c0_g1_i1.p1  ORF type:complete len:351 (-),score=14.90 TRINITY_DN7482_c0_g1_i1:983-2011(-)